MQRIIRRTIITLFVVLVTLIVLLWGLAPIIGKQLLTDFFNKHNAQFSAQHIGFNPFTVTAKAEGIEVTNAQGMPLNFSSFQIELSILPLLEKKILVDAIEMQGLSLDVEQFETGWRVAGVSIANQAPASPEPETPGGEFDWEINLPRITFRDCEIRLKTLAADGAERQDRIDLNTLQLDRVQGVKTNWQGAMLLSAAVNDATIDLTSEFKLRDGQFSQWLDISLITASLAQFKHYLPGELQQGNVNLSLIGEAVIQHSPDSSVVTLSTKRLDLDRVSLPIGDFNIESERSQFEINSLQAVIKPDRDPILNLTGRVKSMESRLSNADDQNLIAGWNQIAIGPLSVNLAGNEIQLNADTFEAEQLILSRNSDESGPLPALASLETLFVKGIKANNESAEIDNIELGGLKGNLHLDSNRKLATLIPFGAAEIEPSGEPAEVSPVIPETESDPLQNPSESPFDFALNRLLVTGESSLSFRDEAVKPVFQQDIQIRSLAVEGINTANPEQAIYVVFEGQTDRYSVIKTDTRVWPFKEGTNADTRTELQEINLTPVSPYVAEALGYDIESGQLDLNLQLTVDDGRLDGLANLALRRFDLGGTDNVDQDTGEQQENTGMTAIPLNVAVGMLKDSDENINLDIPISGDSNNPNFGWGSFSSILFKKALFEASSAFVLKSLIPYGQVLSVAKIAGEQLLKVRIEPLQYPASETNPVNFNSEFVNEFKQLMLDRPDFQVKVCAFASPSELPEDGKTLNETNRAKLLAIAKQRGEFFKDLMIKNGEVKSSRLLLCKPQLDLQEGSIGRLEFEM